MSYHYYCTACVNQCELIVDVDDKPDCCPIHYYLDADWHKEGFFEQNE